MSANDILRSNKTSIVDTLGADYTLILNKAYEKKLITQREYKNLKSITKEKVEGHVVELVDKIMNKGEETCQAFLDLLKTDREIQETFPELKNILKLQQTDEEMQETFPELKNILEKGKRLLPHPVQASSVEITDLQPDSGEEDGQYELKSQPTGLCLIINNKTFPADGVRRKDVRDGTDKDAGRLGKVFSWLGFRVLMCKDQTKDQMERALKCFASQRGLSELQELKVQEWTGSGFTDLDPDLGAPQHGDAFICCVLSHGDKGVVLGVDRQPLRIKEITRTFTATDQSPLTAKPKVFLIQACQGGQTNPGVASDNLQADGSDSTFIPLGADFLVHTATIEDYYSLRNTKEGSWFIQSVCKQLEEGCQRKEEIEVILRRVNKEVAREYAVLKCGPSCGPGYCPKCGPTTQMPEIRHTLRKLLVLTPRN